MDLQDLINEYVIRENVSLLAKMCVVAIENEHFTQEEKDCVKQILEIELRQ